MPRSENTSLQCDKPTHSKCSIAIIGNICLHRKKLNMLLAVLLLAWEEFYWRTSSILIAETLGCTVAMITKHGNESDRQYCFHSNFEVKVCVEKQCAWDDPIWAETVENIATLSPECRTHFVFGTTGVWTTWFCGNQNRGFNTLKTAVLIDKIKVFN